MLPSSRLRKGPHFVTQDATITDEGKRQFLDLVINLPEQRRLAVDSKVSLVAYERFVTGETDAERETALKQHLDSVRGHTRGLWQRR